MMRYHFLTPLLAALLTASCSNIAVDERLVEIDVEGVVPEVSGDTLLPVDSAVRVILAEDFTGQNCVNCPAAAATLDELHEVYGARMLTVGLHSGNFGLGTPLFTEDGNTLFKTFKITGQPSVLFNRTIVAAQTAFYPNMMQALTSDRMPALKANVAITKMSFDETTRQLDLEISALAKEALTAKLQVWLVEDSIVSFQLLADGSHKDDYVHNHVYRSSLTSDVMGDDMALTEEPAAVHYSTLVPAIFSASHLSVVAFLYNGYGTDGKNLNLGVMQATKRKVVRD